MASDVEPTTGRIQLVNDLDFGHEARNPHVVVAVLGQQKLAWQLHLCSLQGEVTEETAFLLYQCDPETKQ